MNIINKNFKYLTILHVLTLILPLVLYPILTRRLGLNAFGEVIYIQVVVGFFSVFCALGFNISVTRMISENELVENKKNIFWNTIYTKLIMVLILVFPFLCVCDFLNLDLTYCLVMYIVLISEAIFPIWYYQGIQEMKAITIIGSLCKLLVFMLVLLFVKDKSDLYIYIAIVSLVPLAVNLLNLMQLAVRKGLEIVKPNIKLMKELVVQSLPLFYGTLSSLVKDRTNLLLVGAVVGVSELVIYDFIMKCIAVFSMTFVNLTNAQFPEISRNKSILVFKKYFLLIVVLSVSLYLLGCVFILIFSDEILLYIFNMSTGSKELVFLCFMLFSLIPLRAISYQIGLGVLVSNGFDKDYTMNLFFSMIFYVFTSLLLFYFSFLNFYTISLMLVVTVIFELLGRLVLCKRRGVIGWIL